MFASVRRVRNLGWGFIVLCGWGSAWPTAASAGTPEGEVAVALVSQTTFEDIHQDTLYTHNGHNKARNGAQHNPCRDSILTQFQSFGLNASLWPFTYLGQTQHNVVAEKVGTTRPEDIYIVGAHYDTVSNPGADDDASGVAAMLVIAQIVSQWPADATIRFVAFDMEEVGLVGSAAYAQAIHNQGDNVVAMVQLEMLAYRGTGGNNVRIYGRTSSNPVKQALATAFTDYAGLIPNDGGQFDASDHASFEAVGYQACVTSEYDWGGNPHYHQPTDSVDTPNYLDYTYAVQVTKGALGWLVEAAGVQVPVNKLAFTYPVGRPEFSRPNGTTVLRVEVTGVGDEVPVPGTGTLHYRFGTDVWQSLPMTEVSPNVYDAHFPAGMCGTMLSYYFSAQAASGTWFSDPYSAPAAAYTATVAYGIQTVYENLLDADPGWAKQGLWAFGTPTGGGGEYGGPDPTSGHSGTKVYGYNLSGDYENNLPERHLTSTAIDCTGATGVHLRFWRWLGVEQPSYDHAYVRVSRNNSTWTTVWQNASEISDTAWQDVDLDISTVADNQPTVYLRWTMGTTDGGWRYCGWNIDDVRLTALQCVAPVLIGDMNCDGSVGFGDINPFVLRLSDPAGYAMAFPGCPDENGDINDSGVVGFDDINPFVALLAE